MLVTINLLVVLESQRVQLLCVNENVKFQESFSLVVTYEGRREHFNLRAWESIGNLKEQVVYRFHIPPNMEPWNKDENPSKEVLCLMYMGSDLKDDWLLGDLAIPGGATIKAIIREVFRSTLLLYFY